MRRIIHKIKVTTNKLGHFFKVLGWAMAHSKQVKNYKFLTSLRELAYEKMLKSEREDKKDIAEKLKIQVKLLDKIIDYVDR